MTSRRHSEAGFFKSKLIDESAPDNLPYVLLRLLPCLVGMLIHFYARCKQQVTSRQVCDWDHAGILVALLVLFGALLHNGAAWVTSRCIFFGQFLGPPAPQPVLDSGNDVYDARQANKFFGLIGWRHLPGGRFGAAITATRVKANQLDDLYFSIRRDHGCPSASSSS